jgi:hypothetical protein
VSRASVTAAGRKFAEAGMTDQCLIARVTTSGDPSPVTGKPTSTTTRIYFGPCELVAADTEARDIESAGRDLVQQGAVLKLPIDAAGSADVAPGDTATVTLGANGPAPVTVKGNVAAGHHQTSAVSRRIPIEVLSNG